MNAEEFLHRHGLAMNPFAAEDAMQDAVLARTADTWRHPDFAKVLGDMKHPSPAVVFGQRGAGKTALRLQMEHALAAWNQQRHGSRVAVIPHDAFDTMLLSIARHDGLRDSAAALDGLRLSDHMDAMLHRIVPQVVDQVLGRPNAMVLVAGNLRRVMRRASPGVRRDLLLLQVAYDSPSASGRRSRRLRRALRCSGSSGATLAGVWSVLFLGVAAALGLMGAGQPPVVSYLIPAAVFALAGALTGWVWTIRKARVALIARRMSKSIRISQREGSSCRESLHQLPMEVLENNLPQDRNEDSRFTMFDRLSRVLAVAEYGSISIFVDRVDEPTCVAGDPQRMQKLVWPLLSSRFLQHQGLAVKLLLPKELGDLASRADHDFHRGARLDKHNLIDRLQWTGAMLVEVCDARLQAAMKPGARAIKIEDLFDEAVGRAKLADAMERCGTPREACRLMYGAMQEHLSHAGADEHRISFGALEWVRRRTTDAKIGSF